jgi:hypothetical protein
MPFLLVESQLGSLKMLGEVVVPDVAEAILAYRVFMTNGCGDLISMYTPIPAGIWVPGEVKEARCFCSVASGIPRKFHKNPPELYGTCGIHAFKSLDALNENYSGPTMALSYAAVKDNIHYIVGQVWMWGKVIEHEFGYRSEFAELKTIVNPLWGIPIYDDKWWKFREKSMRKTQERNSKAYKALAARYKAELIPPPAGLFHAGDYAAGRTSLMMG